MKPLHALSALSVALLLSACGGDGEATQSLGPDPKLPTPERGLLPSMKIAQPASGASRPRTCPKAIGLPRLPLT